MEKVNIYTTTASTESKEKNLFNRAEYFEKYYIPFLLELGIFSSGDKCIELGCGQGHKLEKLIDSFPEVSFSGLERSQIMLSKARQKLPKVKILEGDITDMNGIQNNSQNIVCLFQVLHHLDEKSREIVYQEIIRILKSDGKVIIIDSFRPESNKLKQAIWDLVNRFYAVLSQYPLESLIMRTNKAIASIISPKKYNPEQYGYFSPTIDNVFGGKNKDLRLSHKITPKILYETIPCISDILIFQKAQIETKEHK